MKKVLSFIKRNRKDLIESLALTILAVIAYEVAHEYGTAERGYEAIGGEIFIPFLILFHRQIWEIFKAPFKAVKSNDEMD